MRKNIWQKFITYTGVVLLMTGLSFAVTVTDVQISNISQTGFAVSWLTDVDAVGSIILYNTSGGVIDTYRDARLGTENYKDRIHFVEVQSLDPNTNYVAQVVVDGQAMGNPIVFQTAPSMQFPSIPQVMGGQIYRTEIDAAGEEKWVEPMDNVLYTMYLEDTAGNKSQLRSGVANVELSYGNLSGWMAFVNGFLNDSLDANFSNAEVLVVDYFSSRYGNLMTSQLRIPVSRVGVATNLKVFENVFPMLANFEAGISTNIFALKGIVSDTQSQQVYDYLQANNYLLNGSAPNMKFLADKYKTNHTAMLNDLITLIGESSAYSVDYHLNQAYVNLKRLQTMIAKFQDVPAGGDFTVKVNDDSYYSYYSMELEATKANQYYCGFIGEYIPDINWWDWKQYRYLKVAVKNLGAPGTTLKIAVNDNDNNDYKIDNADDEFALELPLLKSGVWTEVFIPINENVLENQADSSAFDPVQLIADSVYPGAPVVAFSLISTLADGGAHVLIDNIELVKELPINQKTSLPFVDADWDGMKDVVELAKGLDPNDPSDAKADLDNDGIINYIEIINGTPLDVANNFPLIDSFEDYGYEWRVATENFGQLGLRMDYPLSATGDWNGDQSMHIVGHVDNPLLKPYYVGFLYAWIDDGYIAWDNSYKMLKFLVLNQAAIGDAIKVQMVDRDGDVFVFEQLLSKKIGEWGYYSVFLDNFELDAAQSVGDGIMDFTPSGNAGGLKLLGLAITSRTEGGDISMAVDHFEVSREDGIIDTLDFSNATKLTFSEASTLVTKYRDRGYLDAEGKVTQLFNPDDPNFDDGLDSFPLYRELRTTLNSIMLQAKGAFEDVDGDGLPGWWEESVGLDPESRDGNHNNTVDAFEDLDNDGFITLEEYIYGLNPLVAETFPKLDDFELYNTTLEMVDNTNESNWGKSPANLNAELFSKLVSGDGVDETHQFMRVNAAATNYHVGFLGKYVGNYLFDWSKYRYLKVDVINQGDTDVKMEVLFRDNDNENFEVDDNGAGAAGDDLYKASFIVEADPNAKNYSKSYYIPLAAFIDPSANVGDNIQNFAGVAGQYPGVHYVGMAVNVVGGAADAVADVLIDAIELTPVIYGNQDADSDMLPDGWELAFGLNPASGLGDNGPRGDKDGDGMPNLIELYNFMSPIYSNQSMMDGDQDGLPDNWETLYGLDPTDPADAAGNLDGDALTNLAEYAAGTSPISANSEYVDVDHDNLPDQFELAYVADITLMTAAGDLDGDGISNYSEYENGSNPNDPRVFIRAGYTLIGFANETSNPAKTVAQFISELNATQSGSPVRAISTVVPANQSVIYDLDGAQTVFNIEYGKAYIVKSTQSFYYLPPTSRPAAFSYSFAAGFNTFSKSIGMIYTAEELAQEFNQDTNQNGELDPNEYILKAVYRLNAFGQWEVYEAENSFGVNFKIEPLMGYYLEFNQSVTNWTPAK